MTKTNTKRALLMSGLALLLCVSMLIGSTYAWFTDSVTSGNNIIKSGNLDVELDYKKVVDGVVTDWDDVSGNDELFDKGALWEPGHTEIVFLRVSNVGSLDLKYQLGVNIINEVGSTNVYDEEFKLSDYLVFKVLTSDTEFDYADYDTREEVVAATAGTVRGLKDYNGTTTALADKEVDYLALIVYMPTDVDNNANYKKGFDAPHIELGVNLYATQVEAESDSFGPDYDKNAWADGMKVYDAKDLKVALNNGGIYNLENDIDLSGDSLVVADDTALNLNGNELSALYLTSEGDLSISNGTLTLPEEGYVYSEEDSNVTLENVVIDSESLSVMAYAGGTVTLKNVVVKNTTTSNPIQNYGGNLILENVTVAQEGDANTAWYSSAIQVINQIVKNAEANKWETVSQANTTINGGSYVGKKAIMISAPGGNVTINGGDFEGSEFVIQDDFAPQNYLNGNNYESVITINGGTFKGKIKVSAATKLVINGGTFDQDPSAYVAAGYKAVSETQANGDICYTVVAFDEVSTADGLKKALEDGGYFVLTDNIKLAKPLTAKKDVVIDLNGKTITAEFSGFNMNMFQSQSNAAPSMTITSSVAGAVIDATNATLNNGVVHCYGKTEIRNVTINAGSNTVVHVQGNNGSVEIYDTVINAASGKPFNVAGDFTLGEGTVVNVTNLGSSLISNSGKHAIVIDGAQINVGTFKVNGGAMISLTSGTTLALKGTEVNVGLDTTYTSYFISRAENTTIEGCTFDVTDANGGTYDIEFKPDASVGAKYAWVQK